MMYSIFRPSKKITTGSDVECLCPLCIKLAVPPPLFSSTHPPISLTNMYCIAVLRIRIRSDPDLDIWDRIRIMALINFTLSQVFWCVCKSHKYFWNLCCFTFWSMNIHLIEHIFIKKISFKKLVNNLFRSVSGTGSRRFQKSGPDPVKNRPDPQHHAVKTQQKNYYLVLLRNGDLALLTSVLLTYNLFNCPPSSTLKAPAFHLRIS
jgi:hypothetical protein